MQKAGFCMTAETWMNMRGGGGGAHPVDEGGLRAPAEGVAMGEGLVVHQAPHCLDGRYDLLVCCFHIPAHPTTTSPQMMIMTLSSS